MHANRYDKDNTLLFADLTDIVAYETNSDSVIAFAASRNAKCCEKINDKAFIKIYTEVGETPSVHTDYKELKLLDKTK